MLSTSDVAAAAGTTLKAIRLWEGLGLFGTVERNERGDRLFTDEDAKQARIIAAAQMAGMSLADINRMNRQEIWEKVNSAVEFLIYVRGMVFAEDFDL